MACSFGAELNLQCGAEGCQREAEANFHVIEAKPLCRECAQDKTRKGAVRLVDKEGVWYCKKHEERPADIFCGTHRIAVCPSCMVADHREGCCSLKVIEDAAKEERDRLEGLYAKGLTKREELMRADAEVTKATDEMEAHLEQQVNALKKRCQDMEGKVRNRAHKKNMVIDRETEEEVQKLRALQEQRKRANNKEMEEEIRKIAEQREELLSEADEVAAAIKSLIISPTKTFVTRELSYLNEGLALAGNTLTSDKYTFTEGSLAQKSLDELVDKKSIDITDACRAVKCTKDVEFLVGDSKDVGRIDDGSMKICSFMDKLRLHDVTSVPQRKFLYCENDAILDLKRGNVFLVNVESKKVSQVSEDVADVVYVTVGNLAVIDSEQEHIFFFTSERYHPFNSIIWDTFFWRTEFSDSHADSNLLLKIYTRQIMHVFDPACGTNLRYMEIHQPFKRGNRDMIGPASSEIVAKKRRTSFMSVNPNCVPHLDQWEEVGSVVDGETCTYYGVYVNRNTCV